MARCGCGGSCGCSSVGGTTGNAIVTVTGTGTPANPYTTNVTVPCTAIRPCLSAGTGITYDSTTGVISTTASSCSTVRPCLSGGGGIDYDSTTGVISANVSAGCGVIGNGTPAAPIMANTSAWPYPCAIDVNGGVVSCDPVTGLLYSPPLGKADMQSANITRNYPSLTVPTTVAGASLDTFTVAFVNPDTCRSVRAIVFREVKVDFDMPGTGTTGPSRAAYSIDTVDTYRQWNNGVTTTTGVAIQTAKTIDLGVVLPGGTLNYTLDVVGSNGLGGATYTRITTSIRVLFVPTS